MNGIDTLLDKRSVAGARLEDLLTEREYTKSGFCKACGMSKPTLDKILSGMIGSVADYEKHMRKILDYLNITPDVLIGNAVLPYSRVRQLRSILHIKKEEIAEAINVSIDRLGEIEAGASMTKAELRDLALSLGTSSHCILGQNVFSLQTTVLDDIVGDSKDDDAQLSGFWGHIGIMPTNSTEYIWYPITGYEERRVLFSLSDKQVVIPCMNNKLLYLNLTKIKSVVLLEDACDAPYNYNWDPTVGEGEIPLVVYEVLDDYFFDVAENDVHDTEYSPKLQEHLNMLIKEEKWTEEDAHEMIYGIRIRYADGSIVDNTMEMRNVAAYGAVSDLADVAESLYIYGDSVEPQEYISFTDWNGAATCLNKNEVSVIEMPLITVEKMIIKRIMKDVKEVMKERN